MESHKLDLRKTTALFWFTLPVLLPAPEVQGVREIPNACW